MTTRGTSNLNHSLIPGFYLLARRSQAIEGGFTILDKLFLSLCSCNQSIYAFSNFVISLAGSKALKEKSPPIKAKKYMSCFSDKRTKMPGHAWKMWDQKALLQKLDRWYIPAHQPEYPFCRAYSGKGRVQISGILPEKGVGPCSYFSA